jgi:predicted PurR-regulated permease PerM
MLDKQDKERDKNILFTEGGMRMSRKGVSTLLATVLLVLITVCAIGIIWFEIMPKINEAIKNAENQTAERNMNHYIISCQKDCEELEMGYIKLLNSSLDNGIKCYCSYRNGRGGIPVRIW